MWKAIAPMLAWVLAMSGSAGAVCGDVTGEGSVSTADALAVLQTAVGQHQDLTCDCPAGGSCATDGNDGCEGFEQEPTCTACCEGDEACSAACDAASGVTSCDNASMNESCAQEINDAGCGPICCPGE